MFDFFDYIIDIFSTIFHMIINICESITTMFSVVTHAVTMPIALTSTVPTFLSVSIISVVSISVIKLILGWGNS